MTQTIPRHVRLEAGEYAVLALHGLRSTPLELQPVLKSLHAAGMTVFAPHMPGYGFSNEPETGPWQQWLTEALAHFDELASKHRQVAVCGLSMGATLALAVAAARKDRISALAAFSTTLYYDGWNTPWYRFLRPLGYYTPLRNKIVVREKDPFGIKNLRLREWIARQVASGPLSAIGATTLTLPALHQAEGLMRHTRKHLHEIVAPGLILHSSHDDVASLKSATMVQRRIRANDVRLVQLHDSYHMITLDNEREHVAALTVNFFNDYRQAEQANTHPAAIAL
jgi:carboxylesterase